jgi:hypothetical protein
VVFTAKGIPAKQGKNPAIFLDFHVSLYTPPWRCAIPFSNNPLLIVADQTSPIQYSAEINNEEIV